MRRFGAHWRVLLSHLVLFGFIYPGERSLIPSSLMKDLDQPLAGGARRADARQQGLPGHAALASAVSRGLRRVGLRGCALTPRGSMTEEQIAAWTAGIDKVDSGGIPSRQAPSVDIP